MNFIPSTPPRYRHKIECLGLARARRDIDKSCVRLTPSLNWILVGGKASKSPGQRSRLVRAGHINNERERNGRRVASPVNIVRIRGLRFGRSRLKTQRTQPINCFKPKPHQSARAVRRKTCLIRPAVSIPRDPLHRDRHFGGLLAGLGRPVHQKRFLDAINIGDGRGYYRCLSWARNFERNLSDRGRNIRRKVVVASSGSSCWSLELR